MFRPMSRCVPDSTGSKTAGIGVQARRQAEAGLEMPDKMGGVAETELVGYFRNRAVGGGQKFPPFFQTPGQKIGIRGLSENFPETPF